MHLNEADYYLVGDWEMICVYLYIIILYTLPPSIPAYICI